MPEILSQSEIDSLLSGVQGGPALPISRGGQGSRADKEAVPFDFRLPHRLSKNQLRVFQAVHENFGDAFGTYFVSRLQTNVTINVRSVEQLYYSDFVVSLPSPSCLFLCRIVESDALMIVEFSPQLVLAIVERLLGGQGEGEIHGRQITRIEQSIIKGIVQRALIDLQAAWKTIDELSFKLERYESEGDFAQIAPTSEIVLVVSFEVAIGDRKYEMSLCFPTFALDAVLAKLNVQNLSTIIAAKKEGGWSEGILQTLSTTTVPATGVLGEASLTVRELLELEVGDILRTNIPINGEVKVIVGDKPRLKGRPGISNGKVAVKVTRTIHGSELGA